jgi:hypothetical protein
MIRRTLRTTTDERVRALCRQLLLTDFVTELRTALTDADTGAKVRTFRDWYAGRKFAEYATSTGEATQLIAAHESTLARMPNNLAAQLALAYLHEARGENAKAQALWAKIDPVGKE